MYQLLCHVNVPVSADTCLMRTADRAIFDFVPDMKWTVVITIKYYDIKLKGFWDNTVAWLYILIIISIREPETSAIFNAKKYVGRTWPGAQQATIDVANPFILLVYIILQNCVFLNNYYLCMYPRLGHISIKMLWVKKSSDNETSTRRIEVVVYVSDATSSARHS